MLECDRCSEAQHPFSKEKGVSGMRCPKKFIAYVIFLLCLPAIAGAELNHGLTNQEIFSWVGTKLEIDENYPMPQIQLVSQEKLQQIFRKTNKESFKRWAGQYGKETADEMIAVYLKEVIGLFVPRTCSLYVGNFIEPCKRKSIIAHELVHYLQHLEDGPVPSNTKRAEQMYLFREMQAGNIEQSFMKTFCDQVDAD